VRDSRDAITAELQAWAGPTWLGLTRGNLLTSQWRKGFAEQLGRRYGGCPWLDVLDDACLRVLVEYRTPPEPVVLAKVTPIKRGDQYLVRPLLHDRVPTVLVGDGGVGKSTVALAIAVSVATGLEVLPGVVPVRRGPVLYLDWEDRRDVHGARLQQIAAGLGIDPTEDVIYQEMVAPLPECWEDIQVLANKMGVVLLICDSFGLAAAGEPETGQAALDYFRALHAMGLASLTIAHVAKQDLREGEVRPYGSVFVRNSARAVWSLRQQEFGSDVLLEAKHQKSNRGRLHEPLRWRLSWTEDALTIRPLSDEDLAQVAESTDERVLAGLRALWDQRRGEGREPAVRASELVLLTGLSKASVWRALERICASGQARERPPARPGGPAEYLPPTVGDGDGDEFDEVPF
jgi:hypothetical protein